MHFIEAKTILTPQNGMNLYRGCTDNCIYCDARSKCYRLDHEFSDAAVKLEGDRLLTNMLKKKRSRGMIVTGTLSDPYMAEEAELKYMRKCLKVIERYDFGAVIQTKSSLILRDMDIISSINRKTKCVVVVVLSGTDDTVCGKLEPGASSFTERVHVLESLAEYKIPCILDIDPVIPMINDTEANLHGLLELAAAYHVYGIEHKGFAVMLRDGSREYFHQQLAEAFPEQYAAFMEQYGKTDALISPNKNRLLSILNDFCDKHGIIRDQEEIKRYKRVYENKTQGTQLSIFDFL